MLVDDVTMAMDNKMVGRDQATGQPQMSTLIDIRVRVWYQGGLPEEIKQLQEQVCLLTEMRIARTDQGDKG